MIRRVALFLAAVAITVATGGMMVLASAASDTSRMLMIGAGGLAVAWIVLVVIADHCEHIGLQRGRSEADAQWRAMRQ